MATSTLISAPNSINQEALGKAIENTLIYHEGQGHNALAVADSMRGIRQQIHDGEFGEVPEKNFDVSFQVGTAPSNERDFEVAFTWHW